MAAEMPGLKELAAAYRAKRATVDADALRPDAPEGTRPAWGTLGAAIDHRIRYSFADGDAPSRMVEAGMMLAAGVRGAPGDDPVDLTALELREMLASLIHRERPSDRSRPILLDGGAEEDLLRICYVMSWFEEVARTGRVWPGTPLGDCGRMVSADQLLAAVPAYVIVDLTAQVRLASSALAPLRSACLAADVCAGPMFTGSRAVGGADADLIVGDLLLDIKAKAATNLKREDFYQIIGYVLLDFDDRYRIGSLGVYLSRFGHLITWTVDEYLVLLGARRTMAELRQMCAEMPVTK
jgi:hypothetical protein